jgi:type IV secretory pathway TrbF-like protein
MASKDAAEAAPQNPYLAARREWNERYGDHIKSAQSWRLAAMGSIGIALISVGGLAYSASQSKFVPYVVEVDKLNATLPIGPADRAGKADARIVRSQLASWIANTRSVYLDAGAEQRIIREAYALIDQASPAFQTVNEFMRANDPFERAKTETVSVEVQTVLPLGGDTWRVEWMETTRGRDGAVITRKPWQAVITTAVNPPTDERAVLTNPLGIFVTALSWSERL